VFHDKQRLPAIVLALLLIALSICAVAFAEQAAPSPEALNTGNAAAAEAGTAASYEKIAENHRLALYVNKATLGMKVEHKDTGDIWNGTLDEKDEKLNAIWQSFFESGVTIEYMDPKRSIRMASITGEQAKVNVQSIQDGFTADVHYENLGIALQLIVRLTEDALEITVPDASIEETKEDYRLQSLFMYPYFGATKGVQEESGYMVIPDGSGALIGLNEPTLATQPYIGRVYGEDLGLGGGFMSDSFARAPEPIYLPAFGIAPKEGDTALVSFITGGDVYSEIRAYPSGVTTEYNWTTPKWIYREQYFQPIDLKGNGMTLNQEERNRFDASQKIMLLTDGQADYSGMAKRLRQELDARGMLPAERTDAEAPPLRIEFVAAETKRQMLGSVVLPMTTVKEMERIVDDLRASGVDRMMVVIRGWTKGGATGASPDHFPFERKVGTEEEWKAFVEKYKALGVPVYFLTDYVLAHQSAGGYQKSDILKTISGQFANLYNQMWFLQPESSRTLFRNEIPTFAKYGMTNLAMESIGDVLFSSYGKEVSTRGDSMEIYQAMLSEEAVESFAVYRPKLYLWKYADRIMDLPMGSSNFLLETEEIPFLQLVLKGYADYDSPASNFHANPQEKLLRMIDYASYPSFFVTDEDPVELLGTGMDWLYTSQYSVWKEQIVLEYETVAQALASVKDASFEKREKLREGVFRNSFSNGTVIYINYSLQAVTVDGSTIPAQGYLVREGGRS